MLDYSGNGAFGEGDLQYAFGKAGDAYITGDWNADGKCEVGVVRDGTTWLLDASGNGIFGPGDQMYTFGKAGDVPVSGRWRFRRSYLAYSNYHSSNYCNPKT